jgi:hypothetical protein
MVDAMTTPLPLSVPATNVPHTHVRRQDLSELIAGIPHVLGTSPTNSLVLYTFGGADSIRLATTLTGKLPPPTAVGSLVARALTATRLIGATAVIAVVVGGEETPTPSNPLPHRVLVETLRHTFESEGIVLVHASWVNRTDPGEPWRCYDDITCHDTVPDAVTSTLTAAASVAGVAAFSTREDLAALLAPDGKDDLAERSTLLDEQLRKPSAPYTADELTADLELIKRTIHRARESRQLPTFTDLELVRLAHAIAQAEVRDECLMIALGPGSDAAERVWLALVRALPAPERAEAAFLLAMSTFLRGEVVVAALALETALEANPAHALAPILTSNLTKGTTPTQLRAMLVKSVIRAAELRATRATDDDPPWETTPIRPSDPDSMTPADPDSTTPPAPDATRPSDPHGTTPARPPRPTETLAAVRPEEEPLATELRAPTAPATPTSFPELPDLAGVFLAQSCPQPSTPEPLMTDSDLASQPPNPDNPVPAPECPDMWGLPAGMPLPAPSPYSTDSVDTPAIPAEPLAPPTMEPSETDTTPAAPRNPDDHDRQHPAPHPGAEPSALKVPGSLGVPPRSSVPLAAPGFPDVAGWPPAARSVGLSRTPDATQPEERETNGTPTHSEPPATPTIPDIAAPWPAAFNLERTPPPTQPSPRFGAAAPEVPDIAAFWRGRLGRVLRIFLMIVCR